MSDTESLSMVTVNKSVEIQSKKIKKPRQNKKKNGMRFQARTVVFTWNNPNLSPSEFGKNLAVMCQWYLFQVEKGEETETIHYQGMAYHKNDIAWRYLFNIGCHVEKCWAPLDSINYCQKVSTRIDGPFEWGKRPIFKEKGRPATGLSNDEVIQGDLKDLVDSGRLHWRHVKAAQDFKILYGNLQKQETNKDVRGIWYHGKTGSGKSHEVRRKYGHSLYLKAQNKWFDGYTNEETILLDDFDQQGKCLSHYMKIWADKYPCTGEVKGAKVNLHHKNFIVTSQYTIGQIWPGDENEEVRDAIERRFKLINWTWEDRVDEPEKEDSLKCDEDINLNLNNNSGYLSPDIFFDNN